MDVIFDVDGTLMDLDHRRKFLDGSMGRKDWSGFVDATEFFTKFKSEAFRPGLFEVVIVPTSVIVFEFTFEFKPPPTK